jgi:hypothetical protein
MFDIHAPFQHTMQLDASPDEVFDVVANVPDSVSHFADVQDLEPHGDGFRWTLLPAGHGRMSLQLQYGCRYTTDTRNPRVSWTPIDGVGTARVHGHWAIDPLPGGGTRLTLHNHLTLRVDAPRLLRKPAEKVLQAENARMLRVYLANLTRTFGGGDGRVNRLAAS